MRTATPRITPPLKWHGGKHYLASRIVKRMPPHTHYVEAFAGGLAVLLAKDPESVSEVVNDLDGRLTNFWRVLQDLDHFANFQRRLEATPFSEAEWQDAEQDFDHFDPVTRAAAFFTRCRQSLAGRFDTFAPRSRTRTRRGMNEQASAWLAAVDGLFDVHHRLRPVLVLNHDALDVIREEDGPETLFYLDPPYLHETRTAPGVYAHEITADDHRALLRAVCQCRGKVMLSGYPSFLYREMLEGWKRHTFDLPNQAASGATKRRVTECLWCNF